MILWCNTLKQQYSQELCIVGDLKLWKWLSLFFFQDVDTWKCTYKKEKDICDIAMESNTILANSIEESLFLQDILGELFAIPWQMWEREGANVNMNHSLYTLVVA